MEDVDESTEQLSYGVITRVEGHFLEKIILLVEVFS